MLVGNMSLFSSDSIRYVVPSIMITELLFMERNFIIYVIYLYV